MLGRVLNTHQQWLCQQLADLGLVVNRQVAVPDTGLDIQQAVREALGRADLILVTGGLGPTSDDLTRDLIAQLLNRQLNLDSSILAGLRQFFADRGRTMPEATAVQAQIPEGAIVLPNAHGTAPGLAIEVEPNPFRTGAGPSWLFMLPGPPRELRPMFLKQVAPWLPRIFPGAHQFACRTFQTTGVGESTLQEKIAGPLQDLVERGLDLGYCARVSEVEVRLSASGAAAKELVGEAASRTRNLLGPCIFSQEDETLEAVVAGLLAKQGKTLAVAESCTGGYICHRLTNIPGASGFLMAGLVTYSNESKRQLLGVPAATLETEGAVSAATAAAMAEGARARHGVDAAISVTGIAGPSGGTPEKPVGTVFMALASAGKTIVERHWNRLERESFKQAASQQALDLLRRHLLGLIP